MSLERRLTMTCDWCGREEHYTQPYAREKIIRRLSEKSGWMNITIGGSYVRDFCCNECVEHFKEEWSILKK